LRPVLSRDHARRGVHKCSNASLFVQFIQESLAPPGACLQSACLVIQHKDSLAVQVRVYRLSEPASLFLGSRVSRVKISPGEVVEAPKAALRLDLLCEVIELRVGVAVPFGSLTDREI